MMTAMMNNMLLGLQPTAPEVVGSGGKVKT